jgi:hypothetical protein
MKVLFLDIDGVLNHVQHWKDNLPSDEDGQVEWCQSAAGFDPSCVAQLKRIIEETGCEVCVSSSWRYDRNKVFQAFDAMDISRPKWFTPIKMSLRDRRSEIMLWIVDTELNPLLTMTRCAIVDDEEIQLPFFVKTNGKNGGLTVAEADQIIRILNS